MRVAVDLDKPVMFDPAQLQQVVGNMLDNALRYCRHVPGSILLAAYALDETHAELVIWNDGPEVPTEQQRSLFEPFFTNDAQGTGLGLYMARELCSANDAQIRYGAGILARSHRSVDHGGARHIAASRLRHHPDV